MTWLDHFACALVDQAAIQSEPVVCKCGRTAESRGEALGRWWVQYADGWQCVGCQASMTALVDELAADEAVELRCHLARVLEVVERTGGYMSPEDQEAVRVARRVLR